MGFFNVSRLSASAVLAAALGLASLAPGRANASEELVRVLVNVADVIYRNQQPYYHDRNDGRYDQVVMERDRYQRPVYYRYVPRNGSNGYRSAPPYGNAYGYHRNQAVRYDRDDRYDRYDRYDRRDREHDKWHSRHDDRRGYKHKGKKKNKSHDRWDD